MSVRDSTSRYRCEMQCAPTQRRSGAHRPTVAPPGRSGAWPSLVETRAFSRVSQFRSAVSPNPGGCRSDDCQSLILRRFGRARSMRLARIASAAPLRSLAPLRVVPARDASRFPQHANLHPVIAAAGASRQMHAHAELLDERQRTIEFVRQKSRDVLTFPQ